MSIRTLSSPGTHNFFDNDLWLLPQAATIMGTDGNDVETFNACDDNLFRLKGVLHATDMAALHIVSSALNTIRLASHGKLLSDTGAGVSLSGDGNGLYSAGLVRGGAGVVLTGDGNLVHNTGRIVATGVSGTAVLIGSGTASNLENDGIIRSQYVAVTLNSTAAHVENSGTIHGVTGITVLGSNDRVVNHGKIVASGAAISLATDAQVENYGLLRVTDPANHAITSTAPGGAFIDNHGRIAGDVLLGSGDDVLMNEGMGRIVGDAALGSGDDAYFGGTSADKVDGGADQDLIEGGAGDDRLHGGDDGDELGGGSGDDRLHGDAGFDDLYGGGGNDRLFGEADGDQLFGGNGDDQLDGGAGNDDLAGNKGDDVLTGGAGTDSFRFAGKHPGHDRVTDWAAGDQIDLSAYSLSAGDRVDFVAEAQHHHNGHLVLDLGWIAGVHGKVALLTTDTELTAGDFSF